MGFYVTEAVGDDEALIYHNETERGVYQVVDTTMGGERLRLLLVDGMQESVTSLDPASWYAPRFRYLDSFQEIVEAFPDPERVLLIGGAGFAYPKYFFSSGQRGRMTVVELDGLMIELARRYFFLDELEREYRLAADGRLRVVEGEGLRFLEESGEMWDLILNDAYLGNQPDQGLLSDRGLAACRDHLAPGGVLAVNLITPLSGEDCMRGMLARSRMGMYFEGASLYPCDPARQPWERQNCMLVGRRPGPAEAVA